MSIAEARLLADEITKLARAHDDRALVLLDQDLNTRTTLAELPPKDSRQALVHLDAARAWQARHNQKVVEKLEAASAALDRLDVQLARGILRKLDWEVFDERNLKAYNELVLSVEARSMELDEIRESLPSEKDDGSKSRWFKRS